MANERMKKRNGKLKQFLEVWTTAMMVLIHVHNPVDKVSFSYFFTEWPKT